MKSCKTCKHWQADGHSDGHSDKQAAGLGIKKCKAIKMFWDSTKWSREKDGLEFIDSAVQQTAFVQDGSDYWAALYTLADHGCTMHENIE